MSEKNSSSSETAQFNARIDPALAERVSAIVRERNGKQGVWITATAALLLYLEQIAKDDATLRALEERISASRLGSHGQTRIQELIDLAISNQLRAAHDPQAPDADERMARMLEEAISDGSKRAGPRSTKKRKRA